MFACFQALGERWGVFWGLLKVSWQAHLFRVTSARQHWRGELFRRNELWTGIMRRRVRAQSHACGSIWIILGNAHRQILCVTVNDTHHRKISSQSTCMFFLGSGIGSLADGCLTQIAFSTACSRPAGSPGEVQRELICRIIVSSRPIPGGAVSVPDSTDKSSEGARSSLDPSHCYAAQTWTTSWYLISIAANVK